MSLLTPFFQSRTPTISSGVWRMFIIAACALLGLIVILMAAVHQIQQDRAAVMHTGQIHQELESLGEDLLDAESGQRGYLLTQNQTYLSHYHSGDANARARIILLGKLITDPTVLAMLDRLLPIVEAKLAELSDTVALTGEGRRELAMSIVIAGSGQRYMDDFRSIRADMIQTETRQWESQRAELSKNTKLAVLTLILGGGSIIAILFVQARLTLRKLGEPVRALLDAMSTLREDTAQAQLVVTSNDEIGEMAAAFNNMIQRLAISHESGRDTLSQLVASHERVTDSAQQLRKSQSFLARSGAAAGVGGWEIDLRDRKVTWSEEISRLLEVDRGYQPTMEASVHFYTASARASLTRAMEECIRAGTAWDLQLEVISAKGRQFWARSMGMAEFEDGVALRLVGALQDITERRRLEQQVADNAELLRVTLECIGDGVITTDPEGRVRWLNPVAEFMTGWSREEALQQDLTAVFKIVRGDPRVAVSNPVAACLRTGSTAQFEHPTLLISRAGCEYGIEDSAAPIRNANGDVLGAVLVFHDVTEKHRMNQEVSHRAAHDALTGLVNRLEFETRLTRLLISATEEQRTHVLLFIDLDEFKVVNDACGHAAGDLLLRQVSRLLQGSTRSRDTVARLGGD